MTDAIIRHKELYDEIDVLLELHPEHPAILQLERDYRSAISTVTDFDPVKLHRIAEAFEDRLVRVYVIVHSSKEIEYAMLKGGKGSK